jgi:hypothetical protein
MMALFIEHDLIDYINAASTVVIALFTVVTGIVVWRQLRASKDIERAWAMVELVKDPYNDLFLAEAKDFEGDKIISVTTSAFLQLRVKNEGDGPVWIKKALSRMVLVGSEDELPNKPHLDNQDDQHWYPAPFVVDGSLRFKLTANGSQVAKNLLVVYGKITYLDKFREERFTTFGYIIKDDHGNVERLKSRPEYNRNT